MWHNTQLSFLYTVWVSNGWWISFFCSLYFYMTLSMKSNFIKIFSQCASFHLPFLLLFIFCHFQSFFKYIYSTFVYLVPLGLNFLFTNDNFFSGIHWTDKILRKIFYLKAITSKLDGISVFNVEFDNSVTYGNIVLVGVIFLYCGRHIVFLLNIDCFFYKTNNTQLNNKLSFKEKYLAK